MGCAILHGVNAYPSAIQMIPAIPHGAVEVPSSKSYTNRALLLAALANGRSVVNRPLQSDDAEAMAEALRTLGVRIEVGRRALIVHGRGGFQPPERHIHCRDSGTTIRFLTAAAALADFPVTLTGSPQLQRRPLGPLIAALQALGVSVLTDCDDGCPPVTIQGPLKPGPVVVDAAKSSQYASALLMALGATESQDASVRVENIVSEPYIRMTMASMAAFGTDWEEDPGQPGVYRPVTSGGYSPADYAVEFDASAAGHLFAVAAVTGGSVRVSNVVSTVQPDAVLPEFLEKMGCELRTGISGLEVVGPNHLTAPGTVSMRDWPDMLSTVAVVAAFAEGTTTITDAGHARGHETDRIAATAAELRKMGISVLEQPDGLVITGGRPHGADIDTYGDHRMAMAFAVAGAAVSGIVIREPSCVRKTYPDFWEDLRALGVGWQEWEA